MKTKRKITRKIFSIQESDRVPILMDISKIPIHESVSAIFDIQPKMIDEITISMENNGYDSSQPMVIGKISGIGDYLLDGHTRLQAAIKAGIKEVPVVFIDFDNLEYAQRYTIRRQSQRRNLTQGEILQAAILMVTKDKRDGSGRSIEKLGEEIGISPSSLVHARTVAEKAGCEDIQAIRDGKVSINSVYQKIKSKKPKKETTDTVKQGESFSPSISISVEDILRILIENDEKNAISLILEKYRKSVSDIFIREFGL